MKYCAKCGREIDGDAVHCVSCGTERPIGAGTVVGIVVCIILLIGCAYFVANQIHGNQNYANLGFEVHSTHITETVDVLIYIDGEEVFSFSRLTPGTYLYNTYYYPYRFQIGSDHKLIEVKAVSYGGGLGSQTDTKQLVIYANQTYNLKFNV